jgi:WD40 repeat protein
LAFLADGRRLLSGSADATARLWDVEAGKDLRELRGHKEPLQAVAVDAGGRYALTAGNDRTVRLWDLQTGRQLRGFQDAGRPLHALALTSNGQLGLWESAGDAVQTGQDAAAVTVVEIHHGKTLGWLRGHQGSIAAIALAPDGGSVLVGGSDHAVRWWRLPGM